MTNSGSEADPMSYDPLAPGDLRRELPAKIFCCERIRTLGATHGVRVYGGKTGPTVWGLEFENTLAPIKFCPFCGLRLWTEATQHLSAYASTLLTAPGVYCQHVPAEQMTGICWLPDPPPNITFDTSYMDADNAPQPLIIEAGR